MIHIRLYFIAMALLLLAAASVQHLSIYTLILFLAGIAAAFIGLLLEQKRANR